MDKPCIVQTGKKTYSAVNSMVGSKRNMIELESNFINGSFEIQKQQSTVKERQENVAT